MPTDHIEHAVYVDLETTGATATHDRITEVGIVEVRGGKLLVFVDPNADSQANPNPQPSLPPLDQSSDLGPLLATWGVAYDKRQVVADAHYALTVSLSDRAMPVRHVGMLGIDSEGFDHGDVVSAQLKQMNFASTGALALAPSRLDVDEF